MIKKKKKELFSLELMYMIWCMWFAIKGRDPQGNCLQVKPAGVAVCYSWIPMYTQRVVID